MSIGNPITAANMGVRFKQKVSGRRAVVVAQLVERFESSHRHNLSWTLFKVNFIEKNENEEKEAGNCRFLKKSPVDLVRVITELFEAIFQRLFVRNISSEIVYLNKTRSITGKSRSCSFVRSSQQHSLYSSWIQIFVFRVSKCVGRRRKVCLG